jgi:hypothetical protein
MQRTIAVVFIDGRAVASHLDWRKVVAGLKNKSNSVPQFNRGLSPLFYYARFQTMPS